MEGIVIQENIFVKNHELILNMHNNYSAPRTHQIDININNPIVTDVFSYGENETRSSRSPLPDDFTRISELNKWCVMVYCILFIFAAIGNLLVLWSVFRQENKRKTRIYLLITNLSVADIIVTFVLMPTEIFWRITIAWHGGNVLCKLTQFVRAFGLYLSSNVVICISVDRYFSIVHPLKLWGAMKKVKFTLVGAWIISAAFSVPQIFVYHVASHPVYPEFQQCVTKAFLKEGPYNELMYNVGSVTALYFIPLFVIIYTYTMILWKLYRKSMEQRMAISEQETSIPSNSKETPVLSTVLSSNPELCHGAGVAPNCKRTRIILRCSDNQIKTMSRARSRTLRLTLLILLMFIVCWTPYVVMTMWYMLDRAGASQVDERLQEALFILTVANSVINPLIYGKFGRKNSSLKRRSSSATKAQTCYHFSGVALDKNKFSLNVTTKNSKNQTERFSHRHNVVALRKARANNFDTVLRFPQVVEE